MRTTRIALLRALAEVEDPTDTALTIAHLTEVNRRLVEFLRAGG